MGYELTISGSVIDKNLGNPIDSALVTIIIDTTQTGTTYYNQVYTDAFGIYNDIITLSDSTSGLVTIATDSCGITLERVNWFSQDNIFIEEFFLVCDTNGSDCEAYYIFSDTQIPLTVEFVDLSIGNPENWLWNFGDGTTSTEQNPIHSFSESGVYNTSLTISGNNCYSEFSIDVNVTNDTISNCQAMYTYYQIPQTNTIEFYDLSIGSIKEWNWNFGDGFTSQSTNPQHTYAQPGVYSVSLSITTYDTCLSTYTEDIYVFSDSTQCQAEFSFVLDTLNNTPNTYLFTDESDGNITNWEWNFGDGNTSNLQNPTHVYNNSGNHYVCLTISSFNGFCTSTICDTLETTSYYDFGGQVFIDDYPINIDSNDHNNTAIIYLYRKINNNWEYMDQKEFWKYGYYWFAQKPIGSYLLFAELIETSQEYDNYAPSYFPSTLSWKNASTFTLEDNQQFAVNISFQKLSESTFGSGMISGNIVGNESCDTINNIDINHVLVQLFNNEGNIIAYTYSDENGDYYISNIANGTYTIKAEYPGRYSEKQQLSLNNQMIDNVDLEVFCSHILDIQEEDEKLDIVSEIYPNPASDELNISVTTTNNKEIDITILDNYGKIFSNTKQKLSSGKNIITISLNNLPSECYHVKIVDLETGNTAVKKLIVIK